MTTEQLEELVGDLDGVEWDADGDYIVDHDGLDVCAVSSTDTHKRLILSAPSLARRLIAAEAENDRLREILKENGIAQN